MSLEGRRTLLSRDPWRVFALGALALCAALIILPQIWIVLASLREDGGKFTFRHREPAGIELARETVKGYLFTERDGRVVASLDGSELFALRRAAPNTLEFAGLAGPISARRSTPTASGSRPAAGASP